MKNYRTYIFLVAILLLFSAFAPFLFSKLTFGPEFNDKTGPIGDTIGGITAPFLSIIGSILVFATFKAQIDANDQIQKQISAQEEVSKKRDFETKFFALIQLHRENVAEMNYTKKYYSQKVKSINRKVFKVILNEFSECLKEVRHFSNSKDSNYYFQEKYKKKVEKIIQDNKLKISLIEYATIELSYCIVYFGLRTDGKIILKNMFIGKYSDEYINHLLRYMELKPKEEFEINYMYWEKLYQKDYSDFEKIRKAIYFSDKPKYKIELYGLERKLFENYNVDKYYGGHQHRLGHYFSHLLQTYTFLSNQGFLSEEEKKNFGKLLRSQISVTEQYLIFINSLTCLGHNWELINGESKGEEFKLISFYNIIANLPGKHYYGIYYRDLFPKVDFEFQ